MSDTPFDTKQYESNEYLQSIGLQTKGGSTTPPTATSIDAMKASNEAINKKEEEAAAQISDVNKQEISDAEAHKKREMALFGRQLRSLDQMPELTLKDVQKAPEQKPKNPMEAFQNPAVWLALLASAFTRAPMTAALNAGAAAMKGFREGDVQEMQRKREEWKDKTAQALEQNRIETERYQAAWKKADRNVAQAMAAMQAEAASFKDDAMLSVLRKGDPEMIMKLMEGRRKSEMEILKAMESEQRYQDQREQRERFHKDQQDKNKANISDDVARFMAERVWSGDKSALMNVGRGNQTAANLVKVQEQILAIGKEKEAAGEPGTAAALAAKMAEFQAMSAGLRTAAVRHSNIATSVNEALRTFPLARQASAQLPRSDYLMVNRMTQEAKRQSGDPAIRQFDARNAAAITAYAQAMQRSGAITVHAQERADELLRTADSDKAYNAVLDSLELEMHQALQAPEDTAQQIEDQWVARQHGDIKRYTPLGPPDEQKSDKPKAAPSDDMEGWKIEEVNP